MGMPVQLEIEFAFFLSLNFVLFRSPIDWMIVTHISESGSALLVHMLVYSGNTLTDIPQNNALSAIWISLTQTIRHIKLTTKMAPIKYYGLINYTICMATIILSMAYIDYLDNGLSWMTD